MYSPKKGKKPTNTKEVHRPDIVVMCMLCGDKKPSGGSRNFKVCEDCVRYLKSIDDGLDK